jgi:A/G-specific adenine glycosylase
MDQKAVIQFQRELLSWYKIHQRDLPWRKTRDPYKILVSEIMLQQTQVSRVLPKYEAWLKAFPTIKALSHASTADVLILWSGLGYNRRALYLQRTAKAIAGDHKGVWPETVAELKKLPGIGEYTARAVACFAFDQQISVVDTNVRKVILTKFGSSLRGTNVTKQSIIKDRFISLAMTEKEVQMIADQLLPDGSAYQWNQALMDYASAMLKKEKIPVPKQSKFIGSNRYYRGQTIKLLLQTKACSISYLAKTLETKEEFMDRIVQGLEKDGLVKRQKDSVSLS